MCVCVCVCVCCVLTYGRGQILFFVFFFCLFCFRNPNPIRSRVTCRVFWWWNKPCAGLRFRFHWAQGAGGGGVEHLTADQEVNLRFNYECALAFFLISFAIAIVDWSAIFRVAIFFSFSSSRHVGTYFLATLSLISGQCETAGQLWKVTAPTRASNQNCDIFCVCFPVLSD